MFGKENATTVDDGRENTGTKLGLAACDGARAVAIVGRSLRVMASGGPGCPVQRETRELPPGRPVAVSVDSVLMDHRGDLVLWWWQHVARQWQRIGNVLDEPKR